MQLWCDFGGIIQRIFLVSEAKIRPASVPQGIGAHVHWKLLVFPKNPANIRANERDVSGFCLFCH